MSRDVSHEVSHEVSHDALVAEPHGQVLRALVVALVCTAAAAHLPVIPEHLHEAPYMGVLFALFSFSCLATAAALILSNDRRLYAVVGALCGSAVLAYALTRLVALPQLADDVGNWGEPLGILSVACELGAVALALRLRRAR